MNLSIKKIASLVLVLSLVMVAIVPTTLGGADETAIRLSRDDVGQMAVDYSPTVKGLETQVTTMSTQYTDLKKAMDGLDALYDLLPSYKGLYNSYQAANAIPPNYGKYLELASSADGGEQAQAARMIDGDDAGDVAPVDGTDDEEALEVVVGEPAASMDTAAETALDTEVSNPANMSVALYGQYIALAPQFTAMGITNPNLSSSEEFDTFVYPVKVSTNALSTGLKSLSIATESAKAGIKSGATSLYDTVLMMEGILELQEQSYLIADNDYKSAIKKHENGQMSDIDFTIASNKAEIAKRNRDKMVRDVENLEMSLNIMLGQDVTAELDLFTPLLEEPILQELEFYIGRGLEERSEIETAKNTLNSKEYILEIYDDYFPNSHNEYEVAESDYLIAKMDYDKVVLETEVNIREAYFNLLEKKREFAGQGLGKTQQLQYI